LIFCFTLCNEGNLTQVYFISAAVLYTALHTPQRRIISDWRVISAATIS